MSSKVSSRPSGSIADAFAAGIASSAWVNVVPVLVFALLPVAVALVTLTR